MPEIMTPVADQVDARPDVDTTAAHADLWQLLGELKDKVFGRFELEVDPSTERWASYSSSSPGGARGALTGYTGPEIDWAIHSWLGNPEKSFSNLHLTVWLGPQIKVPHLGIAFGTMPDVWCYLDGVPRSDLMVDLESLDTYYEPANERWFALRERGDISPFISRSLYVREALSETAVCFMGKHTPGTVELLREVCHEFVDRWLGWVDTAVATPPGERAALADRDLAVRRTIVERDPANVMGVRYFGQEVTDGLVRALWGGDRTLPRPTA